MSITKKCVVPGCDSTREDLKHLFPRRVWSAERWREAVKSPIIADVKTEDLWKFCVCHKHFTEEDYHWSQKRRRLNTNSVPTLNLDNQVVGEAAENSNSAIQSAVVEAQTEAPRVVMKKRKYTRRAPPPYAFQPVAMKGYYILVPKSYWQSNKGKNEMILKLESTEDS